jgi:hypothetical protein
MGWKATRLADAANDLGANLDSMTGMVCKTEGEGEGLIKSSSSSFVCWDVELRSFKIGSPFGPVIRAFLPSQDFFLVSRTHADTVLTVIIIFRHPSIVRLLLIHWVDHVCARLEI